MNPKRRTLGLSVVAIIATLAILTGTAAAADFHSEAVHTEVRGEQHAGEDTLSTNAGAVRCSHATYDGTSSSTTSMTQVFTPTYTGCKAFGFVNTTIDVNGCSYRLDANANNVDILCGATPIVITAFNCWTTVHSQENFGSVAYTNTGAGKARDITADLNMVGIKYTQHSKSFPGCTNGAFTNGSYTGSATVRGFNTVGEQVGIWWE